MMETRKKGGGFVINTISNTQSAPAIGTKRVLMFGYDHLLVGLRARVLRSSGYDVEETFTLEEAREQAQSDAIDLLVICHSVPHEEIEKLVTAVRKTRKLMPILCMRTHQFGFAPPTCVSVENSPTAILHALKDAIEEYASPAKRRLPLAS
jgi:hypothetical protein